jgi:hypothetical protein
MANKPKFSNDQIQDIRHNILNALCPIAFWGEQIAEGRAITTEQARSIVRGAEKINSYVKGLGGDQEERCILCTVIPCRCSESEGEHG